MNDVRFGSAGRVADIPNRLDHVSDVHAALNIQMD